MGDHAADAIVEVREHRGKDTAVEIGNVRELCEIGIGGLQGAVDGVVGEVEEERLRAVAGDEVVGLARERVGEVGAFIDRLTGTKERIVGIVVGLVATHVGGPDEAAVGRGPAAGAAIGERAASQPRGDACPRVRDVGVTLVEKAEKFVEAAALWVKFGGAAEVPLADEGGGVAGGAKMISHRFFAGRQANAWRSVFRADGIKLKTETCLVATGEERGAGRSTKWRGDVAVGKARAAGGEGVDVGRGDTFAPVATEFAVAEVVGDDEDDVRAAGGLSCSRGDGAGESGEGEAEEKRAWLHDFVGVGRTPLNGWAVTASQASCWRRRFRVSAWGKSFSDAGTGKPTGLRP